VAAVRRRRRATTTAALPSASASVASRRSRPDLTTEFVEMCTDRPLRLVGDRRVRPGEPVPREPEHPPDGPVFRGRRGRTMVIDEAMARSDWPMDTGHGWGSTGAVGTREPVFTWTPSGPAADGRAVLGRVAQREGGARTDRLRFGTYLVSNATTLALYELVTEEVGRRLDLPTELVVETSYESCERDQNEVCFVCSLPYVAFERRGLDLAVPVAAPVLQGERYGGRPIYFSDVIVHRDSPFLTFLDLRGRSWAYNEPLSWSGYGITRYHLVTLGETNGFFREVVEAGFHREAIREVLVAMAEDSAVRERLSLALVERFVPVDAGSYDDIRKMVDACEAAGFLELR